MNKDYARPLQYVDASQKDHPISLNLLKKKLNLNTAE